jgi:hypothetical protein
MKVDMVSSFPHNAIESIYDKALPETVKAGPDGKTRATSADTPKRRGLKANSLVEQVQLKREPPMSTAVPAPPPRHALGLPAGSIRALLALGILGYLWILALTPGEEGKPLWATQRASLAFIYLQFLMVLIIAHFFTAHGRSIGPQVSTRSPLGLPRGSVRFILLGGYLGLAYYLYTHQTKFDLPDTAPVVLMLGILLTAFFFGHLITGLMRWLGRGTLPYWFQDIQAWFALIGMLLMGVIVIVRLAINTSLPGNLQIDLNLTESILAGVVGFYFGARS